MPALLRLPELNVTCEDARKPPAKLSPACVPALQAIVAQLAGDAPGAASLFAAARTRCVTVTFCNPLSVRIAGEFPDYLDNLASIDHVFADGILLARVARTLRLRARRDALAAHIPAPDIPRVSFDGNSLAPAMFAAAAQENIALALVGGQNGVAARAATLLTAETGVRCVLACDGYFRDGAALERAIQAVRDSGAGWLVAGMGGGMQERFICRLRDSGWQGLAITCGGYLDQVAAGGQARYYPHWVNALHLRAPWRALHEPRRLLPRYSIGYWPFYRAALRLLIAGRAA